ncbi:16574_t:CDS:2 [Entrophospora sp. SA101]|nr:16574_t:CDS:2 [Entrophospora sp. SA101]CAJ0866534.1 18765_t:CDS:2 [Entrophospora sp. SA101]
MAITFLGVESSFGIGGVSGRLISKVQRVQSAFKKLVDLIQDNAESKVISQIENEVNEELREMHDVDIIELELPEIKAKGKKRDKIFEAIHDIFNAEIVDNKLFIKFNGWIKAEIHKKVVYSLDQQLPPTWGTQIDTICVVNGNQYRPDVGSWNPKPARNQRLNPIINLCPPPLLWIEVTYDNSGDRDNAMNKFACIRPYCLTTEFVIIVVPATETAFPANPNPDVASMVGTPKTACPSHAPYLGHWPVGNTVRWYKMKWNRHLVLGCGANIDFNDILQVLT